MKELQFCPDVVIHDRVVEAGRPVVARNSRIVIDGVDVTNWVTDFRVGGNVKGAVELTLTVMPGRVRWVHGSVFDGVEAPDGPAAS